LAAGLGPRAALLWRDVITGWADWLRGPATRVARRRGGELGRCGRRHSEGVNPGDADQIDGLAIVASMVH
jgi:hypothetical protein